MKWLLALALLATACSQPVGTKVQNITGEVGEVVMHVRGLEIKRYENDRAICFTWNESGHGGGASCTDKAR